MISLKSKSEIEIMREAGFIVASAVMEAFDVMEPGITTKELDNIACSVIKKQGAKPAFLGLYGFPATACVSINNEIVHGIPSDERIIKNGDMVTIDCGAIVDGLYSDHAVSKIAGEDINNNKIIIKTTKGSLNQGIKEIKPGNRLGDVSNAIESYVRPKGFELVREYVGHGIGRQLHEPPQVPNIGSPSTGIELRPGLVLAIEPMLTAGGWETEKLDDDWTVVTKDGSMSCHFEHTVAVTDIGFDILTKV